jgi:hypothetical protein
VGLLQGWKVAQLHGSPRDRRRRHRCIPSDRHCLHAEELTGHEAVRRRNGQGGGRSDAPSGLSETVLYSRTPWLSGQRATRDNCRAARTRFSRKQLLQGGFDVIQTKFAPPDVVTLVERLRGVGRRPVIAVAGGVNSTNAVAYVRAGAKVLVTPYPGQAPRYAGAARTEGRLIAMPLTRCLPLRGQSVVSSVMQLDRTHDTPSRRRLFDT